MLSKCVDESIADQKISKNKKTKLNNKKEILITPNDDNIKDNLNNDNIMDISETINNLNNDIIESLHNSQDDTLDSYLKIVNSDDNIINDININDDFDDNFTNTNNKINNKSSSSYSSYSYNNSLKYNKNTNLLSTYKSKPGKTLLLKSLNSTPINCSLFNKLTGVTDITKLNDTIIYLTFNDAINALSALKFLKKNSYNLIVRFYYYKVFFILNNLQDTTEYNTLKTEICDFIKTNLDTDVLYCKIYTKNKKYLGCGNLTVDTYDCIKKLLSKNLEYKNFTLPSCTGTFYKFKYNNNVSNIT